jgi:NitT/TauT family transport system substrate-binding protein
MRSIPTRRDLITGISSAAAAALLGTQRSAAQEAPPEITTIRLPKYATNGANVCGAPLYVVDELLRAEGFTDIRYIATESGATGVKMVARGEIDIENSFVGTLVVLIDAGEAITAIGGLHVGCYELFAHGDIRSIKDLKGRTVGVQHLGSTGHLLISSMAAYVGLDPVKEIRWVVNSAESPMQLFADGKIDAFIGFPPEPQELRTRKIGHVIVNTTRDRPWSQYFCCTLAGNRDFVQRHPVATKRALRAIIKAAEFCIAQPELVAKKIVELGYTGRYDYALQALNEVAYATWRDFQPEDAMRFYSLRLREVGMINSTPNKIIATGTNWRFFNELKRELKS